MRVEAEAIGLVILPLALVNVTVDVRELALATGLALFPIAHVFGTVVPQLFAVAISERAAPFSVIECTVRKLEGGPRFALVRAIGILRPVQDLLLLRFIQFSHRKILGRSDLLAFQKHKLFPCSVASGPRLQFDNEVYVLL